MPTAPTPDHRSAVSLRASDVPNSLAEIHELLVDADGALGMIVASTEAASFRLQAMTEAADALSDVVTVLSLIAEQTLISATDAGKVSGPKNTRSPDRATVTSILSGLVVAIDDARVEIAADVAAVGEQNRVAYRMLGTIAAVADAMTAFAQVVATATDVTMAERDSSPHDTKPAFGSVRRT